MCTVRTECLDQLLIFGTGHLERVLRQYVTHYNEQRPHRGIDLEVPAGEDTTLQRLAVIRWVWATGSADRDLCSVSRRRSDVVSSYAGAAS